MTSDNEPRARGQVLSLLAELHETHKACTKLAQARASQAEARVVALEAVLREIAAETSDVQVVEKIAQVVPTVRNQWVLTKNVDNYARVYVHAGSPEIVAFCVQEARRFSTEEAALDFRRLFGLDRFEAVELSEVEGCDQ
jgi:hypothetical protein